MGDRGVLRTYRHMNGYSSHTYMWINGAGERFWVKYHFKTDQGIEFLTQAEADELAGSDADKHRRDLYESIEAGNAPSWSLKVQIMPFEDAADYRFNPFDLTKVWPHGDYPLIDVGRMTLNRNPEDYFVHIEQAAFEPSNLVPGIGPSPDKMLLGGCSRTRTPTGTGSAPTTPSCRPTGRTPRSTRTPRTARCATNRRAPPARTPRTPTAAPRPTTGSSATPELADRG